MWNKLLMVTELVSGGTRIPAQAVCPQHLCSETFYCLLILCGTYVYK